MKPALAFRQPQYPKTWDSLPNGKLIVKEIDNVLSPWWPKFFGYHILKIGALSSFVDSKSSPIKHQMNLVERNVEGDIIALGEIKLITLEK